MTEYHKHDLAMLDELIEAEKAGTDFTLWERKLIEVLRRVGRKSRFSKTHSRMLAKLHRDVIV